MLVDEIRHRTACRLISDVLEPYRAAVILLEEAADKGHRREILPMGHLSHDERKTLQEIFKLKGFQASFNNESWSELHINW